MLAIHVGLFVFMMHLWSAEIIIRLGKGRVRARDCELVSEVLC